MSFTDLLWYIPNDVKAGHRGDAATGDPGSLDALTRQARAIEDHGWKGALIGTGWGRPDTFTVASALVARTTRFEPLIAIRPGYWQPAPFASAAATLDQLSEGRVRINIVSGRDDLAAYGDREGGPVERYARTAEFMRLVRRLWTEENVTFEGEYFQVSGSTAAPRITVRGERRHPLFHFGGASEAAEQVAATQADVQLFWGEPRDQIAERIARLKDLSRTLDRDLPPLRFGLRITTLVRDTTEQAWADAEAKVAEMARTRGAGWQDHRGPVAVGQQRLLELAGRGDVLDDNLYTAPGRVGGGGAGTTWLVGSAQDVARSLARYRDLGITTFILSDTPYLREIERQGRELLPLLKG
ncbi:LLM class flavin-dependent oxidoreductase [Ancylobacter sp. 6x-1]|uniref:LLM class flavin-dependent oxidoreductase n=1 Tax=Ancylobacter crimeensis TaxID=2579147 RepID=A0ABT0DFT6_9HYPH|nr:LLM class flavin-dependent oxidoreductase [Ancylobacter crimeensis]MCK0198754.1 LLM class flavin-dependent oxidoreductase [Ancylobacter crimeensis]